LNIQDYSSRHLLIIRIYLIIPTVFGGSIAYEIPNYAIFSSLDSASHFLVPNILPNTLLSNIVSPTDSKLWNHPPYPPGSNCSHSSCTRTYVACWRDTCYSTLLCNPHWLTHPGGTP
jgi:hypothetical protein